MDFKVCKQCNKEKPLDEFYSRDKKNSKGERYIYYHPKCKKCDSANALEWGKKNRKRKLEHHKKHNSKPERAEAIYKSNKRRTQNGKYREWQRNNKDKIKEYKLKRQNKFHDITNQEWEACKEYFNYECAYCGLRIDDHYIKFNGNITLGDFHKEHVEHDGANDLSNCVPACKSCNSSKHTYSLAEWYTYDKDFYCETRLNRINKWLIVDWKKYKEVINKNK